MTYTYGDANSMRTIGVEKNVFSAAVIAEKSRRPLLGRSARKLVHADWSKIRGRLISATAGDRRWTSQSGGSGGCSL